MTINTMDLKQLKELTKKDNVFSVRKIQYELSYSEIKEMHYDVLYKPYFNAGRDVDTEIIKTFDNVEEAYKELLNYRSDIYKSSQMVGYVYIITEYYIYAGFVEDLDEYDSLEEALEEFVDDEPVVCTDLYTIEEIESKIKNQFIDEKTANYIATQILTTNHFDKLIKKYDNNLDYLLYDFRDNEFGITNDLFKGNDYLIYIDTNNEEIDSWMFDLNNFDLISYDDSIFQDYLKTFEA